MVDEYDNSVEAKQVELLFDQYSSLIDAISSELVTPDLDCHTLYTLVCNAIYEMIKLKYASKSTITVSIYKEDNNTIEMVSHKVARRELMNPHIYRKVLNKDEIKNFYYARRMYDEKITKLYLNRKQIQKEFYYDGKAGKTIRNYSQYIGYVYHSDHVKYLVEVISYFDSIICETDKMDELVSKYIMPGCYYLKLIDRIDERGKYA